MTERKHSIDRFGFLAFFPQLFFHCATRWRDLRFPGQKNAQFYQSALRNAGHLWLLIRAISGFAQKNRNFCNRFLRYTNGAVLPFYILHQTIIVAAGYFIVQWQIPIAVKLLMLAAACIASTWLIHRWILRPFSPPTSSLV